MIVCRWVRLHPVAVAAGALIAGIAGAVVAVPMVAVGHRLMQEFRKPDQAEGPGSEAKPGDDGRATVTVPE